MFKILICFIAITNSYTVLAEFIATSVKVKGKVFKIQQNGQKVTPLEHSEKLRSNDTILTETRSFAIIKFNNGSKLTVGPNSKMAINAKPDNSLNLITLLKGKVRSAVSKQKKNNNFIIKTPTAALGVRGTDFLTSFQLSKAVSSVATFEGQVAFVKDDTPVDFKEADVQKYFERLKVNLSGEKIVLVNPGEYSLVSENSAKALEPKALPAEMKKKYMNSQEIEENIIGSEEEVNSAESVNDDLQEDQKVEPSIEGPSRSKLLISANTFFRELTSENKSSGGKTSLRSDMAGGGSLGYWFKFAESWQYHTAIDFLTSKYTENKAIGITEDETSFNYFSMMVGFEKTFFKSFDLGVYYRGFNDKHIVPENQGMVRLESMFSHSVGMGGRYAYNSPIGELDLYGHLFYIFDKSSRFIQSGILWNLGVDWPFELFNQDFLVGVSFEVNSQDNDYYTNNKRMGLVKLGWWWP